MFSRGCFSTRCDISSVEERGIYSHGVIIVAGIYIAIKGWWEYTSNM